MNQDMILARAVSSRIGQRFITIGFIGLLASAVISIGGTLLLAHFFHPLWLLLLAVCIPVLGIVLALILLARFVVRRIYPHTMTKPQSTAVDQFCDQIQELIEARATPPPIVALITIKDLVLYREPRTVKRLIEQSSTLRRNYIELRGLF